MRKVLEVAPPQVEDRGMQIPPGIDGVTHVIPSSIPPALFGAGEKPPAPPSTFPAGESPPPPRLPSRPSASSLLDSTPARPTPTGPLRAFEAPTSVRGLVLEVVPEELGDDDSLAGFSLGEGKTTRKRRRRAVLFAMGAAAAAAFVTWVGARALRSDVEEPVASAAPSLASTSTAAAIPPAARAEPAPQAKAVAKEDDVPKPAPPAPAARTGVLVTAGATPGRRIFVDRKTVGETPAEVTVSCGRHAVRVGSAGVTRNVDVPCGGRVDVSKP